MYKKRGKRGQITIFIIIGIILLFSFFIYNYVRGRVVTKTEEIELPKIQKFPLEVQPVKVYVEECVYKIATNAIIELGKHGGYINITEAGISVNSLEPTESDAIDFKPGQGPIIPYWYYLKTPNNCRENCKLSTENIPKLESPIKEGKNRLSTDISIEAQIDRFVNKNLKNCLADFEPLEEQGLEITEQGDIVTTTRITSEDIFVYVEYSLEVKKEEKTNKIDKFYSNVDVNIRDMYNLAINITNRQREIKFLEFNTMNLIVSFSGMDKNKLPPTAEMRFTTGDEINWLRSDVEKKLTQILAGYIQFLQLEDALNYRRFLFEDTLKQSLFDFMIIRTEEIPGFGVDFTYLDWWPIYLYITPSQGEVIRPISAMGILSLVPGFSILDYQFVYDVSYPVLVKVYDPIALGGKGYNFYFALETNVRNNDPLNESFSPITITAEGTMVCDIALRNSGNITINVLDAVTDQAVDKAAVMFSFGDEGCFIGMTDENGTLKTNFPVAMGALLVSKENYQTYSELYATYTDKNDDLTIRIEPYRSRKIKLKKKLVEKKMIMQTPIVIWRWTFTDRVADLDKQEQAFMMFSKVKDKPTDEDFKQVAEIKANETDFAEINLVPGRYKVSINVMRYEKLVIPEDERCYDTTPFWWGGEECVTIPRIVMNVTPSGGLELNNETWYLDISKDKLDDSDTITLYAVSPDLYGLAQHLRKAEDLEQINKVKDYTKQYRNKLQPDFE